MWSGPGNNGMVSFARKLICKGMDSFVRLIKCNTKNVFQVYCPLCLRDISQVPEIPQTLSYTHA
jgi:hypothetical protein